MSWINAVLIPCRNEAPSIEKVISEVKRVDPSSRIIVIDNGSVDRTAELAMKAGAEVLFCSEPGKGRALRMAFEHVVADSYTFIDGDGTYDPSSLKLMVEAVQKGSSMAVGVRMARSRKSFPRFHRFGNWIFTRLLSTLFGRELRDVLSGFRVISQDFALYSPLMVKGFEVEAFYSLEASVRDLSIKEFEVDYYERVQGSHSKLHSFRDGLRILFCILNLFRFYKPLPFFMGCSLLCFVLSGVSGVQPIMEYFHEGYVYAVPRAVLAAALMNLSFLCLGFGLILSNQLKHHFKTLEVQRQLNRMQKAEKAKAPIQAA